MTLSRQISGGHSCPAPINQPYRGQSAEAIDAILTGQVRWSIDGSVLTLTSGQGSLRAIGGIPSDSPVPTWRLTGTAQGATATQRSAAWSSPSFGQAGATRAVLHQ